MKKQERGTFEAFSDGMIALSQWNDNKLVCVVSNFTEAEPTIMVQRWSASKKRAVRIPQPPMVANYNKYIGKLISLIGFLVIIGHVYEARSGGDAFFQFSKHLSSCNLAIAQGNWWNYAPFAIQKRCCANIDG